MTIEKFEKRGSFLCLDGKGRSSAQKHSNKKLCFVSTDKEFLTNLLYELAQDENCYFVKLSENSKEGMSLGRCFFLNDEDAGACWARFKAHPKVHCNIQDDDFTQPFRAQVKHYG
ncbi:MAG TPA: hypothetical protein DCL41_09745 [Bdellovibrionales bacterium]|nr:hypothetical protein [Pseudobdellovibrionaceae bacterium]HAG92145.1 hypothetical protein [Bdellovibrionales bacterium]